MNLLERLLDRGDRAEVRQGRLVIDAASGARVPSKWLEANSEQILADLALKLGCNIFRYCGYSTGVYGRHKSPGLTLRFLNVVTGEHAFLIFNVDLHRGRSTAYGKKGDPLPSGRFRVRKGGAFMRFWRSLGLEEPRRLSDFHDRMGKLKSIYLSAELSEGNRLEKESVRPVNWIGNLEYKRVNAPIESDKGDKISKYEADNTPATIRQMPDNSPTLRPDKEYVETPVVSGAAQVSGACPSQYDWSNKVSMHNGDINSIEVDIMNQTTDEWLQSYNEPVDLASLNKCGL